METPSCTGAYAKDLEDMAAVFGHDRPEVTVKSVHAMFSRERQRGLDAVTALAAVRRELQVRCFPMKRRGQPDTPIVLPAPSIE